MRRAAYPKTTVAGKTVYQHRLLAEAALGKPLPPGSVVHHAGSTLVICPDQAYHMLLHERLRVLKLGGDPNAERFCGICGWLKPLEAMTRNGCRSCAQARTNEAVKSLNTRRREAGLCLSCGKPPGDGHVRCAVCRAASNLAQNERRMRLSEFQVGDNLA